MRIAIDAMGGDNAPRVTSRAHSLRHGNGAIPRSFSLGMKRRLSAAEGQAVQSEGGSCK